MDNEILELLKLIQSDVTSMKNDITSMQDDITSMKSDINTLKDGQQRMEKKLDGVFDQTANLTEFTTTTTGNIQSIKQDIRFVKRKVQDTEEDVFVIQDHLKIIK
ncbi:hypothetical protein KQI77_02235 [Clostridium sp. MSJ-8]|uniref:hypothetical protein n=1 Tax=Clostridium sp. MSJ-8 TaxID=2841510 RepID=UPI001C0ED3E0|nr:hypothetical protein [Clostridium sp. MSJ-8]MBU5486982.1 hypothetical protein [Clostridium sp. MSJ-8]